MPNTLKDLAATAKLVSQTALEQALTDLKSYIDAQDTAGGSSAQQAVQAVQNQLDTLIGAPSGDLDNLINTFNEIKAFLADYDEDDTLKNLIDAAEAAAQTAASTAEQNAKSYADGIVATESTRAQDTERALGGRITTLENVSIMTAQEAHTLYDGVFNPTPAQGD